MDNIRRLPAYRGLMTTPDRRRWQHLDPRLIDGVAALVLFLLLVLSFGVRVHPGQRGVDAGLWILAAGLCVPISVHRRFPLGAVAVVLASLLGFALLRYAPYPGISVFAVLFAVTLHSSRRSSLVALGASMAALLAALALQPAQVAQPSDWVSTLLLAVVAFLAALNLRQRRTRWAAVQERAAMLEREREERDRSAVVAERLRIARELHDVVAHSMSLIAVQAGMGRHVIDTDVSSARNALEVIEATSRTSLAEMRRLLGVLREGDDTVGVTPAPGLDDLPQLIAQTRRSGLGVTFDATGSPIGLPPGVALTAYRIVQEALTNVIKHGGPVAYVRVDRRPGEVILEVTDDGRPDISPRGAPGSGHGLVGMRERVALYGGQFVAAGRPVGGFRVFASLPFGVESP